MLNTFAEATHPAVKFSGHKWKGGDFRLLPFEILRYFSRFGYSGEILGVRKISSVCAFTVTARSLKRFPISGMLPMRGI